jgi:phage major head subunit gpT-like protein
MSVGVATYKAVARDVTQLVEDAVETATPFYPQLCTIVNSNGADEKYSWLGSFPGMREWLGPRQFKQLLAADFTLANKHFESSLEILKTDIDDDRLGMMGMMAAQLGQEAAYHPDELLVSAINNAEAATCFDGQFFFDTDHVYGDSGTQSNDLSYAAATGTTPTPAEFRDAFHAALKAMLAFKRDNGKPYQRPTIGALGNLLVTVPVSLYDIANKAFGQAIVVEGGAGVSNFVIETPRILTVASLSDSKFDLYHLGDALKPYVFQARQPLRVQSKGSDDIEFKEIKVMTEARYNVGYLAWWKAVRTTFT